ncbi:unnamed protein product [Arctogadus glacialis]
MVMRMQKEMDGLREQIRCLTARDKAGVFSSSCQKQNKNYRQDRHSQDHHQTAPKGTLNGGPQCPLSPLYQELIPAELLKSCNTGTTAQKLTNDLLRGLYDRDCLASHSISGLINSKKGPSKPALPGDQIQAILREVQHYFPGKTDSEIKGYIRQKLQNESKRLRKKPLPLSTKEEEPVRRGEGLITYA